jgi:hypothetical protein
LARCSLSLSFPSIQKCIADLGYNCIKLAQKAARNPHLLAWDNINMKTSIFVEQRTDAPAKVQSGTFAVVYPLPDIHRDKMLLTPILERARTASGLDFDLHVRPTTDQFQSYIFQFQVIIVRVLTTFSKPFQSYADHPSLKHKARRPLPLVKTTTYPLRVMTCNEATVTGTIKVWEDVYERQLEQTSKTLDNLAIPSINDQLTNARVRGAKLLRKRDVNRFLRLDNIQLGYGVFHKCMNLIWAILKTHHGSADQLGSLNYFFVLMEKTRLSNDKPDYHTLLNALMQILHGLILQAWREQFGCKTFDEFGAENPSMDQLFEIAQQIISNYGTETNDHSDPAPDEDMSEDEDPSTHSNPPTERPTNDIAHRNIRLLFRDLLFVAELIQAVSDGDWGRIEDILGPLTMMFRGAGSNNYSTELLHFLHGLKIVWGDDFA